MIQSYAFTKAEKEVAKSNGLNLNTIKSRIRNGWTRERAINKRYAPKSRKIYALYKGDELIETGTLAELAELEGVKYSTMYFRTTPTYENRTKGKNYKTLTELDDSEE